LSTEFHEDSFSKESAFLKIFHKQYDVEQQLNTATAAKAMKNRRALRRIIQALKFHGQRRLPLQGHRDSGRMTLPFSSVDAIQHQLCEGRVIV